MGGGAVREARSYTWTFAICPTRIEIDLSVISELEQDLATTSLSQQGLLYGSTQPGSTEIHGLEPVMAFGSAEFARAKSTARRTVLGCYLIREGSSFLLSDSEVDLVRELFCD